MGDETATTLNGEGIVTWSFEESLGDSDDIILLFQSVSTIFFLSLCFFFLFETFVLISREGIRGKFI